MKKGRKKGRKEGRKEGRKGYSIKQNKIINSSFAAAYLFILYLYYSPSFFYKYLI